MHNTDRHSSPRRRILAIEFMLVRRQMLRQTNSQRIELVHTLLVLWFLRLTMTRPLLVQECLLA
jgi:hypothetical protein